MSNSISIKIEVEELNNKAFIVMPFSQLFQIEYEKIIKPAIEDTGLECVRGDEIYSRQRIVDDIWKSIKECRLIVAELTGKNPNVLYEIGLAHALGKPVIILTRNSDDVPFDLKAVRYLFYDTNDPFWGENLKQGLQSLVRKTIDNPEIDKYLEGIEIGPYEYPKIEPRKSISSKRAKPGLPDLAGNWEGIFSNDEIKKHRITIHLSQNGSDISGMATISYKLASRTTVVQEYFNGIVEEGSLTLTGVNYSYVERGNADAYLLDSFRMKINDSGTELIGNQADEASVNGQIKLEKIM